MPIQDQSFKLFDNFSFFFIIRCGHCKALAPAFAAAAKELKKSENPVHLAKVDCTLEKDVCNSYEVQGYPTLKWFKDGQPSDYDGPRDHTGKYYLELFQFYKIGFFNDI